MPRKPRFFLPDVPCHVVQRGKNRSPVFFESSDYYFYLDKLREALIKYNVALHSYVLMTNHIHLLMTAKDKTSISLLMQYVGRFYVPYINHKYQFSGSIWEGRFKSNLIESERYLLACMRYIEENPVRAKMVSKPEEYLFSSFHSNAEGQKNILISEHEVFMRLSDDKDKRHLFYSQLFNQKLDDDALNQIRLGCQSGTPIGSSDFKAEIELAIGRKIGKLQRGRPKYLF